MNVALSDLVVFAKDGFYLIWIFLSTYFVTVMGFGIGFLVMGKLIRERRRTSNIFAWFLLIVFMPFLGVILYFLFGGTKSRYVLRNKARVRSFAAEIAQKAPEPIAHHPEEPYHFRPMGENSFSLLPDEVTCFEALCHEIKSAQSSIHLMTYILGKDEPGRAVVALLAERAREGIEVKLLIDALGSLGQGGRFVDPIRKAGGRVARFMPMLPLQTQTSANLRNHRKMAIFDLQRVITGGQNIDHRFMGAVHDPAVFRDFSALVSGPAVARFTRTFVSDWCFATRDPVENFRRELLFKPEPAGENAMRVVDSGPDMERDTIWEQLIVMIQECREEITIVTPYFLPDEVIMASLAVKAHAGKRIRLILPEVSNQKWVDRARYHFLRELHEEGLDIRFYQPGMLHAKLFLVDREHAMIGSANMDRRSLFVNFEIGLLIDSPGPVAELQSWVDRILPDCEPFHRSQRATPKAGRVFLEDIAYLMAPLL